jgi:histidinol-phosphate phosphatase family protein
MSRPQDDSDLAPSQARLRIVFAATATSDDETRWTLHAVQALTLRGHDVAIAAPTGGSLAAAAADQRLATRALRTGARLDPRVGRTARNAFPKPDAVIALDPAALALARRAAAPLVLARTEHPAGWPHASEAPAAILVPPGTATDSNGGVPIRVVTDAVGTGAGPRPDRTAARRALRLPRRVHLALHVEPLVAGGGQETTLRALAKLVQRGGVAPLPKLAFLGTGPEEARLHVLGHDLGLNDHVLWLGMRKDVRAYLEAVDSLLVPRPDRTPRGVVLDALALAVRVVARATPATRDGLGGAARLVAGGDDEAWAAALAQACAPDGGGESPGEQAHDRAVTELSAAAVAADLECAVYAHDLRRRPLPRRAALFLDRDGTLVRNVPYNDDPAAIVLEPRVGRALRWARDAGFALVVVSNQSGIGRGLVSPAQVEAIHARIRSLLQPDGADLDALYFCPHEPEDACTCRKPLPGLLQRAAAEMDLDLASSVGIGDAPRDVEAARAAGAAARGYRGAGAELQAWPDGVQVHEDWLMLVRDVLADAWAQRR